MAWTSQSAMQQCQFGCGILKMMGPKIQDFLPRINIQGFFLKSVDELQFVKIAKIVLSKSIFDVKNQPYLKISEETIFL